MEDFIEIILIVLLSAVAIAGVFLMDWLMYKLRGHAKPDNPDSKDYPIIKGADDASAHWIVDCSNRPDVNSQHKE